MYMDFLDFFFLISNIKNDNQLLVLNHFHLELCAGRRICMDLAVIWEEFAYSPNNADRKEMSWNGIEEEIISHKW